MPPRTPALIRSLLRRCLTRNPDQRVHDIADARIEIEESAKEPTGTDSLTALPAAEAPGWRKALPWILAGLMAATAIVAFWAPWRDRPAEITPVVRWVDRVVDLCHLSSRHQCLYRAYSRACVLRRLGVPVVVNMGLHNLGNSAETRGHCWLTLHGQPVEEDVSIRRQYPVQIGRTKSGVCFWVGEDRNGLSLRRKRPSWVARVLGAEQGMNGESV